MLICAAGDIHGSMERFCDDLPAFETALSARFDWVLHVGDFGIWPDPEKIDRGTRNHDSAGEETVCVGGVGGCYGPSDYGRHSKTLQGYVRRHYTHDEVERLAGSQSVDIVLTHDAPAGVCFQRHRQGAGYVSQAAGLDVVLARARPRVCFFGHHTMRPAAASCA